jgi:hypothetical protein
MREDALSEYLPDKISGNPNYNPMKDEKLIGSCDGQLTVLQKKRNIEIANSLLDLHTNGQINLTFEGSQDGQGTLSLGNELIYSGEFKGGRPNGLGRLHSSYGAEEKPTVVFEGRFENGKRSGEGKEFIGNTLVFQGEFKEGLRHGPGQMFDTQDWFDPDTGDELPQRDNKTEFRFGSAIS